MRLLSESDQRSRRDASPTAGRRDQSATRRDLCRGSCCGVRIRPGKPIHRRSASESSKPPDAAHGSGPTTVEQVDQELPVRKVHGCNSSVVVPMIVLGPRTGRFRKKFCRRFVPAQRASRPDSVPKSRLSQRPCAPIHQVNALRMVAKWLRVARNLTAGMKGTGSTVVRPPLPYLYRHAIGGGR